MTRLYLSLSVVRPIPWKLVRQFLPWTSSQISLNLRKDLSASFSFCRSAKETSKTRPFRPSEAILVPAVLRKYYKYIFKIKKLCFVASELSLLTYGTQTVMIAAVLPGELCFAFKRIEILALGLLQEDVERGKKAINYISTYSSTYK